MNAPRLLTGGARDSAPSLDALSGGEFEAFFTAVGLDRDDRVDAQLGRLLDHPFESLELDQ